MGTGTADILAGFERALNPTAPNRLPELWDGHAAERIARVIQAFLLA